MNKEDKLHRKIITAKLFRNLWILSVVVCLGSLAYMLLTVKEGKAFSDYISNDALILFLLTNLFFLGLGAISFAVWILSLIDNFLKKKIPAYVTFCEKTLNIINASIGIVFILFVIFVLSYTFLIKPTTIIGNSMGQGKYADKSWHLVCIMCKDIKRGDVVAYRTRNDQDIEFIGRVVGLPDENITIEKGILKVNDKILVEDYTDWSEWNYAEKIQFILADNEYFTLVDKRTTPSDIDSFLNNRKFYLAEYVGKIL
jgi:signal peptidase I